MSKERTTAEKFQLFGRVTDVGGAILTASVIPLQRFHLGFVQGIIAGEIFWEGILKPGAQYFKDLGTQFRGQNDRTSVPQVV